MTANAANPGAVKTELGRGFFNKSVSGTAVLLSNTLGWKLGLWSVYRWMILLVEFWFSSKDFGLPDSSRKGIYSTNKAQ